MLLSAIGTRMPGKDITPPQQEWKLGEEIIPLSDKYKHLGIIKQPRYKSIDRNNGQLLQWQESSLCHKEHINPLTLVSLYRKIALPTYNNQFQHAVLGFTCTSHMRGSFLDLLIKYLYNHLYTELSQLNEETAYFFFLGGLEPTIILDEMNKKNCLFAAVQQDTLVEQLNEFCNAKVPFITLLIIFFSLPFLFSSHMYICFTYRIYHL